MTGPLSGIKVLDLSRVLAGPYCSMMLADLGADVIKIERPDGGDDTRGWGPPWVGDQAHYFLSINRNKRSVALNLKSEEGLEIARQLARQSDVVLENFRPGTVGRLKVGYEDLKKENPNLVYCSISGFGQDGPYRDRPAYDAILQGMGGLMGITGPEDSEPIRVGVAVADIGAGMQAAFSINAALLHRERSGEGQYIDISMMDVQVSWMTYMAHYYFASGELPPRTASAHPSIVPYGAFPASDGWLNITVGNDVLWRRFAPLVGIDPDDERYRTNADRVQNREELIEKINQRMKEKTRDEWLEILSDGGVPCGPIYTLRDIFEDEQVHHREMIQKIEHTEEGEIDVLGIPSKFSETPGEIESAPPLLGEHTAEVLKELGYSSKQIDELVAQDAIGLPSK